MNFTGRLSALSRPLYRRYWLGSFASVGATQLQIMGQGWLLFELTGSPLMLGYLGAAAALPAIGMTIFGGAIADAVDKRKLLLGATLVIGALLLLLGILDFTGRVEPWHIIAIAGTISFINGFEWPTRQAIFPMLIERDDMMSAVAMNSIIWQGTRMMMPAVGGLIMAFGSTWIVFVMGATGFFIMFAVVMSIDIDMRPADGPRRSTMHQVMEGISYIFNNRLFLILIMLSFTSMFFVNAYMQLMPAFSRMLGAGESGYGYLVSIGGVGSVVGTVVIGAYQHSQRLGYVILSCAFLNGAFVYLFSLSVYLPASFGYPIALAGVFLIAMFSSMFMIASMTVLQLAVPDNLRGRVMGLHGITYSLMPLGGLLAGFIANLTSASIAISLCTTIYLLIVIAVVLTQGTIRQIDGSEPQY